MSAEGGPVPRQLPAVDRENAHFWQGGADGRLHILKCGHCGGYTHPPQPRCQVCRSPEVAPAPVSGRATVASFTINVQAWTPTLTEPFVFAAVELEEQKELYVLTNIVDCAVEEVRIGQAVEVTFEQREDVYLPMFRPRSGSTEGVQ